MKRIRLSIALLTTVVGIVIGDATVCVSAVETESECSQMLQNEAIYKFEDEINSFSDLGIMANALEFYLLDNPDSTEKEQEEFLIRFVESGGIRTMPYARGVGDYLPGYNNLNAAERTLAVKHPVQAVKVYNCASKATEATIAYYGTNGWQDNSDAFRHCCWNALMKKAMSESDAEMWATAHEDEASGIDTEMDMFNNFVGRSLEVSGKNDNEIFEAVKSIVSEGKCYRIINNELVPTDSTGFIK